MRPETVYCKHKTKEENGHALFSSGAYTKDTV